MSFDPYYKWLGIPLAEQPPNHYRLLAINMFEADPDVIDAAADRLMAYLRQCAAGTHVAESQKLLNEVGIWKKGTAVINPGRREQFIFDNAGDDLVSDRIADDIVTAQKFGDVRVELEFLIPERSNSGIFLMGEYEINIDDSDRSGAVLGGLLPKVVARKPAGEWQRLEITFRAPRFDARGLKTTNACFVKVVYNGKLIHKMSCSTT